METPNAGSSGTRRVNQQLLKFCLFCQLYFYAKWVVFGKIVTLYSQDLSNLSFHSPIATAAFVGMLVAFNVSSEINCQALYSANQYFGNTGIASSSTLLMLRTFAIWNQKSVTPFLKICRPWIVS